MIQGGNDVIIIQIKYTINVKKKKKERVKIPDDMNINLENPRRLTGKKKNNSLKLIRNFSQVDNYRINV